MDITGWELLGLGNKCLMYLGTACAIGGAFALLLLRQHPAQRPRIRHYLYLACGLGILASAAGFFIQVGAFADRGPSGMLDRDIINVLLQTPLADATKVRISGFILIALSSLRLLHSTRWRWLVYGGALAGVFCVVFSFSQLGHLHDQGLLGTGAITLHTAAVSLWIGALFPLWLISRGTNLPAIQQSMILFGRLAVTIVAVLLVCGLLMIYLLLDHPVQLLTTNYGRGLLLKLALVCGLLFLAARNKWRLVPNLHRPGVQSRLSRAIGMETVVGGLVLMVTAALTSLTGP